MERDRRVWISYGMIRMSLQRELDWQILEGAKIGAQQAPRGFSVRESRYTCDFADVVLYHDRGLVS